MSAANKPSRGQEDTEDMRIFNQSAKDGEWEKGQTKQSKRGTSTDTQSNWPYHPNS